MGHGVADEDDPLRHARTLSSSRKKPGYEIAADPASADGRLALGDEAGDGERHRQPVIVKRLGDRAAESRAAVDLDVVALDADLRARGPERPSAMPGDAVGLLVPELGRAADPRRAGRRGGGQAQDRDLVDRRRHVGGREVDRPERCRPDHEVREGLAVRPPRPGSACSSMAAPMRRRMSMMARRVGFVLTPSRRSSASGWIEAATSQKAAPDGSAGTVSSMAATGPGRRGHTAWAAVRCESTRARSTPRARSIRSVWSRVAIGLRHGRRPVRGERREQDRGLDLGAGHRRRGGRWPAGARRR